MRKRIDPTLADRIIDLRQEGLTYREIADAVGASIYRVQYVITQAVRRGVVERRYNRADVDPPRQSEKPQDYAWLDPLLRVLWTVEAEARRLERCPACLRKGALQVLDGTILGWAAACRCGFRWYRRQGPPKLPLTLRPRHGWGPKRCRMYWLTGR